MWKPVVRCLDAFRSRSGPPSIAHFAIADLAIGCAYTFIVLLSLLGHEGWPGQAMRRWLQVTDGAITALLFFLPAAGSPPPSDELSGVLVYRHLLVACAISTFACVWISRRHWPAWTNRFLVRLSPAGTPASRRSDQVLTAHRIVVLGIAAAVLLLLFAEPRSAGAVNLLHGNGWALFRAPILLAVVCFLACHAAMLAPLLPARDDD